MARLLLRRVRDSFGEASTVVVAAPDIIEVALITLRVSTEIQVHADGLFDIAGQVRYKVVDVGRPGTLVCRRVLRPGVDRVEMAT